MRALALSLVVLAASPSAFALTDNDTGVASQFPSACYIVAEPPPDASGMPQGLRECSCVLVGPQVVLTNSNCLSANVEDAPEGDPLTDNIEVKFATDGDAFAVDDIALYRYYDPLTTSVDGRTGSGLTEFALVHLTADPGIEPAVVNTDPLDSSGVSEVTLVGFGAAADQAGTFSPQKRGLEMLGLRGLVFTHFLAGTQDRTSCRYDAGAPVYAEFGSGDVRLVGITAIDLQNRCFDNINRMRVDRVAEDFILPYVARYQEGVCGADGTCADAGDNCELEDVDCDPCAFDGACTDEAQCGATDWDCPLGALPGAECEVDIDCEFGGTCIAAEDDPSFTYCSVSCDLNGVQEPATCSNALSCDAGSCVYGVPSRGSQGFACIDGSECRSDICEGGICVFPCSEGDTCPDETECLPSESDTSPGTLVCRAPTLAGGGGFCSAAAQNSRAPLGFMLMLGMCGLLVLRLRRRG